MGELKLSLYHVLLGKKLSKMIKFRALFALAVVLSALCSAEQKAARAVVESCSGWQLNRLPQVKRFIVEDLQFYNNAEVNYVGGKSPEAIFYSENDEVIETVSLVEMNQKEINELFIKKGIEKDTAREAAVLREEL